MNHIKASYGTLKPNCPKIHKPTKFPSMSGDLPDDNNDRKRRRSGALPHFSLRTPRAPRRVSSSEDLTGAASAEDLTRADSDDEKSPYVEHGSVGRAVRPTAAVNSVALATSEAVAMSLARSSETTRLAEIPAPLPKSGPCPSSSSIPDGAGIPASLGPVLPVRRGNTNGPLFAPVHLAGTVVRVPAVSMPESPPVEPCDPAAFRHFSPTGALLPNGGGEMARLAAYLEAFPAVNDAALAAIEEAYIRSHEPMAATALEHYRHAAASRKHCAMLGDNFTQPSFEYYARLVQYGLPPLRRVSLIRTVAIVIPDPATVAIQRALIGVLMELPFGYCRSLVGTFLSFLTDARWLCPYGFSADSYDYWARCVFVEEAVPNQHTYLDTARSPDRNTVAHHLYSLVNKSARLETVLTQLTRSFIKLLTEINDVPDRLSVTTPMDRAVARYLEWA